MSKYTYTIHCLLWFVLLFFGAFLIQDMHSHYTMQDFGDTEDSVNIWCERRELNALVDHEFSGVSPNTGELVPGSKKLLIVAQESGRWFSYRIYHHYFYFNDDGKLLRHELNDDSPPGL